MPYIYLEGDYALIYVILIPLCFGKKDKFAYSLKTDNIEKYLQKIPILFLNYIYIFSFKFLRNCIDEKWQRNVLSIM